MTLCFPPNDTPPEEFAFAEKLGAIINLDDITHISCLEETLGYIPETISCRYNPGESLRSVMILWTIRAMQNTA